MAPRSPRQRGDRLTAAVTMTRDYARRVCRCGDIRGDHTLDDDGFQCGACYSCRCTNFRRAPLVVRLKGQSR